MQGSVQTNLDMARLLIDHGAFVNVRFMQNASPLTVAIQSHRTEIARLLIDRGADLNNVNGDSPLMMAFGNHDFDTARLLIQKGADLNARSSAIDSEMRFF